MVIFELLALHFFYTVMGVYSTLCFILFARIINHVKETWGRSFIVTDYVYKDGMCF
jgi:hypothetical protein